ncbi:type II secretion system protein N [Ectopseudomonas mendocina]|uniref:Type II secretion system protein N n=1 Tax=Ectopseudomonas mendocina TaxID=300 RepID=A0ABZ2RBL9_ECTME
MSISLAWQSVDWMRLIQSKPASAPTAANAAHDNTLDPQLNKLFGKSAATQQGPAPSTNLNLTLLGSFVHPDSQQSSAIILNGATAQRYRVGDEISSGVTLHSVSTNQVELMRNGRRESLSFPVSKSSSFAVTDMATEPQAAEENLTPEQLEVLESDDLKQLRERMRELQQQMQGTDSAAEPAANSESDTESQ